MVDAKPTPGSPGVGLFYSLSNQRNNPLIYRLPTNESERNTSWDDFQNRCNRDVHYQELSPGDLELNEIELELQTPLKELCPNEFERYCNLFYRYVPKRPCHIKASYKGGFICQKGKYKNSGDEYKKYCYPELVAKMLDYEKWQLSHPDTDRERKHPDYFWIALREPKKTNLSRIDFDNKHNLLGHYLTGTNGHGPLRPVPMMTLDHFMAIKRIYDTFPNRIWCVSSATLGLHIWDKMPGLQSLETLHRDKNEFMAKLGLPDGDRTKLKQIGLGAVEIHPMPGRACRLPFGQDYYTITEDRMIGNWVEQLNFFEQENPTTPSFQAIYRELRRLLVEEWSACDRGSITDERHKPINNVGRLHKERPHLAEYVGKYKIKTDKLRQDLKALDAWAADGFPTSDEIVAPRIDSDGEKLSAPSGQRACLARTNLRIAFTSPDCGIELSKVCNGNWVQSCHKWALNGLPTDDSIFLVVSQLARWFFFIELWHLPEEKRRTRIRTLLTTYCLEKNNGRISRLEIGLEKEVVSHVERIIDCAIRETDDLGKLHFTKVRQKRDTGQYRHVIYLEKAIADSSITSSSSSTVGFTLCCTVLDSHSSSKRRESASEWTFEPDDSPLPENIKNDILGYYQRCNKSIQKRTFKKLIRFINHLRRQGGEARLGIKSLAKMGFSNHAARQHIKTLEKIGIINIGGYYPAGGLGTSYRLAKKAMPKIEQSLVKKRQA